MKLFLSVLPYLWKQKKKNVLNIAILYLNIDFKRSGGVMLYYHKIYASRKHSYIILTPLNPTFI